jgi:uncharacterized protein YecT (DUF1311 family)
MTEIAPQPAPGSVSAWALENNNKIDQRVAAGGASDACYMAAYGQADHELNAVWKHLPKEVQAQQLPGQAAWLHKRDVDWGNPDQALEPGAMPATGTKGALASPGALAEVEARTVELANIYDQTLQKK